MFSSAISKLNFICILILSQFIFTSCQQKELSDIEKIIIDNEFILTQTKGLKNDSTKVDENGYKKEYFSNGVTTIEVWRDSSNRITAWIKQVSNIKVEVAEVYPNTGQIRGKVPHLDGKIEGEVKYYYEDGRIKSKGLFKNSIKEGEWKNYDENGKLISKTLYKKDQTEVTTIIK